MKEEDLPQLTVTTSRRAQKKALSKKASLSTKGNATKMVFDDEGQAHPVYELEGEEEFHKKGDAEEQKKEFLSKEAEIMADRDVSDKIIQKEKKQEKKRKRLEAMRREMEAAYADEYSDEDEEGGNVAYLGTGNLSDDMEEYSSDEESRKTKKSKTVDYRFDKKNKTISEDTDIMEIQEPETIEDLESLTARLIEG